MSNLNALNIQFVQERNSVKRSHREPSSPPGFKSDTPSSKRPKHHNASPVNVRSVARSRSTGTHGSNEESIDQTYDHADKKPQAKKQRTTRGVEFPIQPNTIQVVTVPKTVVNHTYRDFSDVPPVSTYTFPAALEGMTVPEKIYHLLDSSNQYAQQAIEWCSHGRALRILNRNYLEKYGLLKALFGFNSFKKFRKLLLSYDFREFSAGPDKGCFYSEFLLRGLPHLLQYMPPAIDRRSQTADPDHEPNLYQISETFPLPHQNREIVEEAVQLLKRRGILLFEDLPLRRNPNLLHTTTCRWSSLLADDKTTRTGSALPSTNGFIPSDFSSPVGSNSRQEGALTHRLSGASSVSSSDGRQDAMNDRIQAVTAWAAMRNNPSLVLGAVLGGGAPRMGAAASSSHDTIGESSRSTGFPSSSAIDTFLTTMESSSRQPSILLPNQESSSSLQQLASVARLASVLELMRDDSQRTRGSW